jgi:hypothetical protein
MIKQISIILILMFLASCANVEMPKRKAFTGENNTLADVICKK